MKHNTKKILFLLIIISCNRPDDSSEQNKDFYNTVAGWDIKHIPIVPPYRVTSTEPNDWVIHDYEDYKTNSISVVSFGVSKNYIYGITKYKKWFLFNMKTRLYAEYLTKNELFRTLKKNNLGINKIEQCDNYYQQLPNKRCYWYPKIGDEYPKFEDVYNSPIYTIIVNEREKAIDFDIKGNLKKDFTKLYFFKFRRDEFKNDSLYVSFNHRPYPQLIKENELFWAYSEDNDSLEISFYTKNAFVQNKAINENVVIRHTYRLLP